MNTQDDPHDDWSKHLEYLPIPKREDKRDD